MTWIPLTTIKVGQNWQFTPEIASDLGYVRFRFATAGTLVMVAQVDLADESITDQRRIVASGKSQIHVFESLPVLFNRALALRLPVPTASFDIQIEVSDMPVSRTGSTSVNVQLPTAATVTATSPSVTTTSSQLLAANSSRKMASFTNNAAAILYLELGATASNSAYTVALNQGDLYELPIAYTGVVSGVLASGTGNVLVREFT